MEDYRLTQAGIIEELIASHSVGLENPITQSSHPPCKSIVVLLTGSTGNLGTEILACLLENDTVERVYAYNRPCLGGRTILQRHEARFADRGLDIPLLNSRKLVFIEGHTSVPYLGLTSEVYREARVVACPDCWDLAADIHNAAQRFAHTYHSQRVDTQSQCSTIQIRIMHPRHACLG